MGALDLESTNDWLMSGNLGHLFFQIEGRTSVPRQEDSSRSSSLLKRCQHLLLKQEASGGAGEAFCKLISMKC